MVGLSSDASSAGRITSEHVVLANHVGLRNLSWSPSQTSFLSVPVALDGDWSGVVDRMNLVFHV